MSRKVDVKALISHIVKGDGADKCRICMGDTSEGQVYLSDTVMMDQDRSVTLAEVIQMTTGVEMSDDEIRPVGACSTCTTTILAAHDLQKLVWDSQEIWTKAVDALSELPNKTEPKLEALCMVIRKETFEVQILRDFFNGSSINKIRAKRKATNKSRVTLDKATTKCPDCGKLFTSPFNLNVHLKNSGQKEACLICGDIVVRGQKLKEHLLQVHKKTAILCPECPLLFSNADKLARHKKTAHRHGVLTCSDCGRTFAKRTAFDMHMQMHAVRTCRACGAQFSNRGCYREHRSLCEPEAKPNIEDVPKHRRSNIRDPATFICDYCSKTYRSRPQLKNHILWKHLDVRPYQCQWCGKKFYTSARLVEHSVVHTRVRNFECDICGAKLVTKMAMIYHRRRHTGEKPYECKHCGEKFISASRRSEHSKRRHGTGLRLQCLFCPMNYVRSIELRRHVERAHTDKNDMSTGEFKMS